MKTKKNNKFNLSNCSPNKNRSFKNTCYNDEDLLKLRSSWNKRHPDKKITSKNSREIWKQLKNHMSSICKTEMCWLKQEFIKKNLSNDLINYTFAPFSPKSWNKNINEWLSSMDISNVMKQYEKADEKFIFLGPSPIDFDKIKNGSCIWPEICKFNLNNIIKRNHSKIGFIFNTDPHFLDGSHWISLFVDLKKEEILFFDSVGDKCPNEIDKLINRIIEQGKELNIHFKRIDNKKKHQKSNTECGMYSLYFIIENIKNNFSKENFKNRISDENMESFRKIYFNSKK
jgi:hypothetical protein